MLAGVLDAVKVGLAQSIHVVFLYSPLILAVGCVVVLFLPRVEIHDPGHGAASADETAPAAEGRSA